MPTDTQSIVDAAEKLGTLIIDHPSVTRYVEAQKAVAADPETSRLFQQFDQEVMAMSQQEQAGQPLSAAQKQRLQSLQQVIASNLKVKAFSIAQVEMTELLRKVSTAWQKPIAEVQQAGRIGGGGGGGGGERAPAQAPAAGSKLIY